MPNYIHEETLELPIRSIWNFVSEIDNWAPLIPGYISHEFLNDRELIWSFKANFGLVKKKIDMMVNITEWKEPSKVAFQLTGLSDHFEGWGYFQAEDLSYRKTKITGFLDIEATGHMAQMKNNMLKNFVPETAYSLTNMLAEKIKEHK